MRAIQWQRKFASLMGFRLNHNQTVSTLCTTVKLDEIPDVCAREDWSTIMRESRAVLQNHSSKSQFRKHNAEFVSAETVMKRIQKASHRNSYLVNTFQQLLANTEENANELRWPGLITLMLSKGIGNPFVADNFVSKSLEDNIWSSQVTLAEIINLFHCKFIFKKENARLASTEKTSRFPRAENEINRVVSNYFTSIILHKMSTLSNYKVVLLLGDVLESLAKAKFPKNENFHLFRNLSHWEYDTFHPQGLLLASGCQATLELAGYDEKMQQKAFEFGQTFMFALKAHAEIQHYYNYQNSQSSTISISSFPISLHLQNYPETLAFIYNCDDILDNLETDMLNTILESHSAIHDAQAQLEAYVQRTITILHDLQITQNVNCDVTGRLIELVNTLNHINYN